MPYTPHTLFAFGGQLAEPVGRAEVWECGIRGLDHNTQGPVPDGQLDAWVAWYATKLQNWFTDQNALQSSGASLQYLKINNINAAGKYANPGNTHLHDFGSGVVGHQAPTLPNFLSIVYTWETGLTRGRAHRGRMYPPNGVSPFSGGMINSAEAGNHAQAAKLFIQNVLYTGASAPFEDYLEPQVFSRLDGSHHPITGVSCDTIIDVQRRRKNQAVGTRTAIVPVPVV